jgi:hypothetical protein
MLKISGQDGFNQPQVTQGINIHGCFRKGQENGTGSYANPLRYSFQPLCKRGSLQQIEQ